MAKSGLLHCDAFACKETHPLQHEHLGAESFGTGRWLGWLYLDLNRPDLWDREMRFCSVACLQHWLEMEIVTKGKETVSALDEALRRPQDELARHRALAELAAEHG